MAAVARTICQKVWNCSVCVVNNCLFLISEDKTTGCYESIVGRPKIKKQLETEQDCLSNMGGEKIVENPVGDTSNDIAEILGSGTVGIVIGVLVTVAVCCFFLRRRQRQPGQNPDPEVAEQGDNEGEPEGGNYSPRNLLRALGVGLRAGAIVSNVIRRISQLRQLQNDQVPLVPNEVVEHPLDLEPAQNQNEEIGLQAVGRVGRIGRNFNPRNILRVPGAVGGVVSVLSEGYRRISAIRAPQNNQFALFQNQEAEDHEDLAMENVDLNELRVPSPEQIQVGAIHFGLNNNQVNVPRMPLMDPDRFSPIRDLFEDGVEDAEMARILNSSQLVVMNNSAATSTSTDQSSLEPNSRSDDDDDSNNNNDEDDGDLSDTTDSTLVPGEDDQNDDFSLGNDGLSVSVHSTTAPDDGGDDYNSDEDDNVFLPDTVEHTAAPVEDPEFSEGNDQVDTPAGDQDDDNIENERQEDFEEVNLDSETEAAASFTIGSSESTPVRRSQPPRAAKTQSNEMIKAMHKHKLI